MEERAPVISAWPFSAVLFFALTAIGAALVLLVPMLWPLRQGGGPQAPAVVWRRAWKRLTSGPRHRLAWARWEAKELASVPNRWDMTDAQHREWMWRSSWLVRYADRLSALHGPGPRFNRGRQ